MREKGEYFKGNSVAYTPLKDDASNYDLPYGRIDSQDKVVQQFAEWLDFDTSSGLIYKGEDGTTYRFVIPYSLQGLYSGAEPR
jgi:hypothetical protein